MLILGIETSCDETAVALYDSEKGILGQCLRTQIALHQQYGGVIPELASRDHAYYLPPLLRDLCAEAGISLSQIEGIAYTAGPGLVGALLVGAMFGRSLAYALKIPAVGVHHMEGHLLVPLLEDPQITFPFLALLVSGGHTLLVEVTQIGHYEILGQSLDDAAGEAFDKTAKLLGLPYPGGPQIQQLAQQGESGRFSLPRPLLDKPGYDFSFSGLKTAVLQLVRSQTELDHSTKASIALAFQEAVVDTLTRKCQRALRDRQLKRLVVAGGVSANQALRKALDDLLKKEGGTAHYPSLPLCTDNAVMIAYAGHYRLAKGQQGDLSVSIHPRWDLTQIP